MESRHLGGSGRGLRTRPYGPSTTILKNMFNSVPEHLD